MFFYTVKLKEYLAFAVIVLSPYSCVGSSLTISFFYILLHVDKLLFLPKKIAFLPKSKFEMENNEQEYLSGSAFLVSLTAQN